MAGWKWGLLLVFHWSCLFSSRARRSVGVQSTAIDALLEESDYVFGDGDAEIGDDLGDEGSYGNSLFFSFLSKQMEGVIL